MDSDNESNETMDWIKEESSSKNDVDNEMFIKEESLDISDMSVVSDNDTESINPINSETQPWSSTKPITLWQFMLELLTDKKYTHVVTWIREKEGRFKILDTKQIVILWSIRKNRTVSTWENLARGLRYYNQGKILHKVTKERLTYQFQFNIQEILGYSSAQLFDLIHEVPRKPRNRRIIVKHEIN